MQCTSTFQNYKTNVMGTPPNATECRQNLIFDKVFLAHACPHSFELEEWLRGLEITLSHISLISPSRVASVPGCGRVCPPITGAETPSRSRAQVTRGTGRGVERSQCYHADTVTSIGAVKVVAVNGLLMKHATSMNR